MLTVNFFGGVRFIGPGYEQFVANYCKKAPFLLEDIRLPLHVAKHSHVWIAEYFKGVSGKESQSTFVSPPARRAQEDHALVHV